MGEGVGVGVGEGVLMGTGGGRLGTVRLEELVMAPDVHGSGLLSGGKDSGRPGRCTRFSAQVPLGHWFPGRQPELCPNLRGSLGLLGLKLYCDGSQVSSQPSPVSGLQNVQMLHCEFWRHALQQSSAVWILDAPGWLPASSTMISPW